jgi:hypothetical protein
LCLIRSISIIGCGWISGEFVKDVSIQRDDVTEVYHAIAAVGSRDISKAQKFIEVRMNVFRISIVM